ncbi:ATP-binding protein [Nocardiopsis algeriensis]|uniref:Histidine kinase/HSP90-like ATPase domain-containing protein n=1 Tax=Nocardiopsis algeriensis TaxID=1478215 RepID=A0A841IJH7_9ACTN|nr:ATP-binding protein [Nocardiopsis algeriensis]MBB6118084.1 hypothetical protein [Nocardiopsis algeriensis]
MTTGEGAARLPRRVATGEDGVRMVSWGSAPQQVASARQWCLNGTRLGRGRAYPLLAVASELHTNALRHTASGSIFGRVRMRLARDGHRFRIAVTDEGTLGVFPRPVPEVGEGFGLRLVSGLAESWGWLGEPGFPITVWAVVDLGPRSVFAVPAQRKSG